jgi:hypothetical protein
MVQRDAATMRHSDFEHGDGTKRVFPRGGGEQPLLAEAERLAREQAGMLEAAPIEQTYGDTLESYVLAKQAQVMRIEERLESLILNQTAELAKSAAPKPWNVFKTKKRWEDGQAKGRARIYALRSRLAIVRKIETGMGLFRPRIEELATRKMRAEHPALAVEWDAAREAHRKLHCHEMEMHRAKQNKAAQNSAAAHQNCFALLIGDGKIK